MLPQSTDLKHAVFYELHASPLVVHFGFIKTYELARRNFFWKGVQHKIQHMVSKCVPCQHHKGETTLHPYITSSIAQIFMAQIFLLHGIPYSIVSEHNTAFTSPFRLPDTKLHMSSVYHPPIEGSTTVVNKYCETYFHCFISEEQHQWEQWLPLAEWWYNNSYHTASKMTP